VARLEIVIDQKLASGISLEAALWRTSEELTGVKFLTKR
jgi:hypothetical protein